MTTINELQHLVLLGGDEGGGTLTYTVKKKECNLGVLHLSHSEYLIWRGVTPKFLCMFYTKLGVLHTNSVCFPTNVSVFSHSL